MIKFLRFLLKMGLIVLVIIVSILFYRAYDSRSLPDLQAWHLIKPLEEPLFENDFNSFEEFVKIDKEYVKANHNLVASENYANFERYNPNSKNSPSKFKEDFNSSFILNPGKNIMGIIVLIHGLSDSPYHIRDAAKHFYKRGYYVFGLRMPGHGTLPSGLLDVEWQDWQKAAFWAMRTANKYSLDNGDIPVLMGGFSTGGTLSLNYAFNALNNDELKMPEKIILFSPAAGVSELAVVGDWHKLLSWMSYFYKFAWLDIIPEYDPAKYMSFTKNAGRQIFMLCQQNLKLAEELSAKGNADKLPAIIAFESWVDATVKSSDLLKLYDFVGTDNDRLVMFDVNEDYSNFFKSNINYKLEKVLRKKQVNYSLQMISNRRDSIGDYTGIPALYGFGTDGDKIEICSPKDGQKWRGNMFALSHISIPISPRNKLYGKNSRLSKMHIIGEKNVLIIPSSDLNRIRYNPFFDLMMKQVDLFIEKP